MTSQEPVVHGRPMQVDFRLLVEESLAGFYVLQQDRFLYVNRTMAQLFGYTAEELLACASVVQLVAPEDRERVRENLRLRYQGQADVLQYSFQARRRDGSTFQVEVRGRLIEVDGEHLILGTLLDVSERAQEMERLRFLGRAGELLDSSLDYEATLESLARLAIPSIADLCVIEIRYDGVTRRLVAGRDPLAGHGFTLEPREAAAPNGGWVGTVLRTPGGVLEPELSSEQQGEVAAWLSEDGASGTVRSLIAVPLDARGQQTGAMLLATTDSGRLYDERDLAFARDVARAAALAVDNAHLYREATRAIERREEILAVVSHDLRNPLNAILMSTSLALEQDRRQQGPLARIHGAARQMERLIRDLLDISAIDAGGFSVERHPCSLASVVRRTIELHEEIASSRSIRLEADLHDDLEIEADSDRLLQALSNLVGNAIKFTPEGGTVRITIYAEGDKVDLAVTDSGPGISPDESETVFERFWRGGKGTDVGTGLGLAIVKGIVEAHGGHVRVQSAPGRGATFHLELPAA